MKGREVPKYQERKLADCIQRRLQKDDCYSLILNETILVVHKFLNETITHLWNWLSNDSYSFGECERERTDFREDFFFFFFFNTEHASVLSQQV